MSAVLTRSARAACAGILYLTAAPALQAQNAELPPQVGYNYGETETARVTALGGARRALGQSIGALFTNPAGMATSRVYHVGAIAQIWPEASRQSYGAAAVDSIVSSSGLAGGIGGSWNIQDKDRLDRQWTDLRFAFAYPFSDEFSVGLGGHYQWLKQSGLGPLGDSLASGGLHDEMIVRGIGVDAGVTVRPVPALSLALVSNNLNDPGHGFLPMSVGGGAGVAADLLAIEGDMVVDFSTWNRTKWRGMLGGTLLLGESFPLSAGYRYDSGPKSHAASLGAGYVAREFSAELGLRRVVVGEKATAIVLELRYHVDASGLAPSAGNTF